MPFPVSVEASMEVAQLPTSAHIERVVRRIGEMLDNSHSSSVTIVGSSVEFRSGLLPGILKKGPLQWVSSGRIDVEPLANAMVVRYRLVTLRLWHILPMMCLAVAAIWRSPTYATAIAAVAFFAWIVALRYVGARRQFAQWLYRWFVFSASEYRQPG